MNTILVPTDFSDSSGKTLDYALFIASKLKAKVILFNVYPVQKGNSGQLLAELELVRVCKEVREQNSITISYSCTPGKGATEILREAIKVNADLIIMGATGASDVKRMILGSNAYNVINTAKIPVIAVPNKNRKKTIKEIVLAVGAYSPEIETLKKIGQFAAAFDAGIVITHVSTNRKDPLCVDTKKIIDLTGYKNISCEVLIGKNIVQEMNHFLINENASMLVMVRKDKPFMKSIIGADLSRNITFTNNIPLLVFHESLLGNSLSEINPSEILG